MRNQILIGAALGALSSWQNGRLTIRNEQIIAPVNLRITHLCDLHYPKKGIPLQTIQKAVEAIKPHVICITGDLFDQKMKVIGNDMKDFIVGLTRVSPVLYVRGNHEVRLTQRNQFEQMLVDLGVHICDHHPIEISGVTFYGVDELNRFKKLNFNKDDYNVLLAHHPEDITDLKQYHEIDLMLSGHVHGGQIRLFNQGIFAPGQGFLPHYTKGLYQIHDRMKLGVSAGIAAGFIRQRINNPPEIVVIDLIRN